MNAHTSGIYDMAQGDEEAYYEHLMRRRELLRAELSRLDEIIEAHKQIVKLREKLAETRSSPDLFAGMEPTKRRRNALPPAELAKIAREVILEAGVPLTRSEIVTGMEARGIDLVGRDRIKNVGTILWRHKDAFENIPDRGYWPKDVPLKERGS